MELAPQNTCMSGLSESREDLQVSHAILSARKVRYISPRLSETKKILNQIDNLNYEEGNGKLLHYLSK